MRRHTITTTVLVCLVMNLAMASPQPVRIGGEAELDACASTGQVAGLNPDGDNFLSVRAGPSTKDREIDRLYPGKLVYMCETSRDGQWIGIVYELRGEPCGVSSAIAKRRPYRGRCRSGWVARRYIELVAG